MNQLKRRRELGDMRCVGNQGDLIVGHGRLVN